MNPADNLLVLGTALGVGVLTAVVVKVIAALPRVRRATDTLARMDAARETNGHG